MNDSKAPVNTSDKSRVNLSTERALIRGRQGYTDSISNLLLSTRALLTLIYSQLHKRSIIVTASTAHYLRAEIVQPFDPTNLKAQDAEL